VLADAAASIYNSALISANNKNERQMSQVTASNPQDVSVLAGKPASQFGLLKCRRFLPLFCTQFLGALNDNVFRNALLLMVTFHGLSSAALEGFDNGVLVNLATALFMLPWFLFSAIAGQLAEKYDKARVIQIAKFAEILIMILAGAAFVTESLNLLMFLLFLMGTQSAFFGPVKYSILPQHLHEQELVGGNGLVELATFVGIILGVLIGGQLVMRFAGEVQFIAAALVVIAAIGWLASLRIPQAAASTPDLEINWNVFTETHRIIRLARKNQLVWLSVIGNCWFWAYGGVALAQLPEFARGVLGGNETAVMGLYAVFAVGVAVGSLLCEKLSRGMIELGIVPIGAIGLTIFGGDIWLVEYVRPDLPIGFLTLIQDPAAIRMMFDMTMLGLFGGLFIVPLYAVIQARTPETERSRVTAANNIISSIMMVAASGLAALGLALGMTIPEVLAVCAVANIFVCGYIFWRLPQFAMRALVWVIVRVLYRSRIKGAENIPDYGAAVLVCNHISFMDAMLIMSTVRRPVRFVMDHKIFNIPVARFIFRTAGAIPIASGKDAPEILESAYDAVEVALLAGELVCVFPEGEISRDGEMQPFKAVVERIIKRIPVPVIPMALRGMWGSFCSRRFGSAMKYFPRRFWSKVEVAISTPIGPADANAIELEQRVLTLRGDWK
jgi:1-acyl-sn-glycerol-3-phosphate acyltransferase